MEQIGGLTLTARTRRVVEAAIREARRRGHGYLGTEHLLLGLLTEPDAIASRVLAELGVSDQARDRVIAIMDSTSYGQPTKRYDVVPEEWEGELRMPLLDPAMTDEERTARGLPAGAALRAQVSEENRRRAALLARESGLPDGVEVRRVWRPWTRDDLLERREREGAACWRECDELVFVHQADTERVQLTGGLQSDMWRVEGDLWVVSYRLRRIEEAFVSYAFVAGEDYRGALMAGFAVWRGPAAPRDPAVVSELQGELHIHRIPSRHLAAPRTTHAYLSPGWRESPHTLVVHAADAAHRARLIEPLVLHGKLPPVICLGVEFLDERDGRDGRADEYLLGRNAARFDAHMAFQADELPAWTAEELGLSPPAARRIVTGQSNGGAFAISAGLQRPDMFGHVLAFSVAGGKPPNHLHLRSVASPRFHLVAGALESFRSTTAAWRDTLRDHGLSVRHGEMVAGHDPRLWDIAFLTCLKDLDR